MGFINVIMALLGIAGNSVKNWQDRQQAKAESEARIAEARTQAEIARIQRAVEVEAEWDLEALRQSEHSWKDEWLLFVFSLPFVGSFLPVVQDYVQLGWDYVGRAPIWYQTAFIGVVAATFGLRWMLKRFADK